MHARLPQHASIPAPTAIMALLLFVCWPRPAESIETWRVVDGDYGAATRVGRIVDLGKPGAPGEFALAGDAVLVMGSDNGGFSRSAIEKLPGKAAAGRADWGVRWQPANGGRGFSAARCSGYEKFGVCRGADENQPIVFGGPAGGPDNGGMHLLSHDIAGAPGWPRSMKLPTLARITALARSPTGKTGRASGLLYRVDGSGLSVSPDAGSQFFPLAPHCALNNGWRAALRTIAADPAVPGRVVVASGSLVYRTYDVAGCWIFMHRPRDKPKARVIAQECSRRRIAYTDDVGPQVAASILATADEPATRTAAYDVDLAGGPSTAKERRANWRYASVAHLAVAMQTHRTGAVAKACTIRVATAKPGSKQAPALATVPGAACPNLPRASCHGKRSLARPADQSCRNVQDAACQCLDEPACRYPIPGPMTIDPRNGFIYTVAHSANGPSHAVGILHSPDGRHWQRHGSGPYLRFSVGGDTSKANFTDPWPYTGKPPTARGVRLLTHAGLEVDSPSDDNALDLNANPSFLVEIGRISVAFTPCPTDVRYAADANGMERRRGHLTWTVPVQWRDPKRPEIPRSDVFIGHERADCRPDAPASATQLPGPLVFRSSRGLDAAKPPTNDRGVLFSAQSSHRWLPEAAPNRPTKLPMWSTRARYTPRSFLCRVQYHAAAVAPSDSRVLYAWAWSYQVAQQATANRPYRDDPQRSSQCGFLAGLWRSVDRGRSWHLAVGRHDPQSIGEGQHVLRSVDLSVLPNDANSVLVTSNPRRSIGSGSGASILYVAANGQQVYARRGRRTAPKPAAMCQSTDGRVRCGGDRKCRPDPTHCRYPARELSRIGGSWCDKSRAHPDLCALWRRGKSPRLACSVHRKAGLVRCLPADPANPSPAKGGEAPNAPAPAQCAHVPRWATLQPAWKKRPDTAPHIVQTRPLTARCRPCSSATAAANTADESTDQPAPRCCLVGRDMRHAADPASLQCVPTTDGNHIVAPTRTMSRGHGSGSVHSATVVEGADNQLTVVLGMDDGDTGLARRNATGRFSFARLSRALLHATHVFRPASPHAVRAVLAATADRSVPGRAWLLANGSNDDDDFLRLLQVDGVGGPFATTPKTPTVRIYPSVLPASAPRNAARVFRHSRWSGRDLLRGHNAVRIVDGPHGLLIVSAPGAGVFVLPRTLLTATPASAWSKLLHGANQLLGPVARPIPFVYGKRRIELGACVADVAVASDDLYIAVGRRLHNSNPGCVGIPPGLYRARLPRVVVQPGAAGNAAWRFDGQAPEAKLVRAFNDPHVIAIHSAARPGSNVPPERRIVVADWSGYGIESGCKGALWLGINDRWKVLRRTDAVAAMHIQAPPGDTTGRTDIWYAISSQPTRGAFFGGARIAPLPGRKVQQALRRVPPSHAGIYRQSLRGFAATNTLFPPLGDPEVIPANCMKAPPFGQPGNRQVHGESCHDDKGLCRIVAGVLPAKPAIGPARAGQMYSALTGRWDWGIVTGTVYGQGAWFRPPL